MAIGSRTIKSTVTRLLASLGLKLSRIQRDSDHDPSDVATFIAFRRTMEAARAAGLSVGDYVDTVMNKVPGSSQNTIDKMTSVGVFSQPLEIIVEIGPGTGRYLEKTIMAARPSRYEIYETAGPWASYLVSEYKVALQPTDGYSLAGTANASVDLVHAHKVFSTVPFMVTTCYLQEMARVIRIGGWAAFDVVTERCLDADTVQIWAKSGIRNGSYPAVFPRSVVEDVFAGNGFELAGSFIVPMKPGTTELLVFKRTHLL
jgi:hypothetical protein